MTGTPTSSRSYLLSISLAEIGKLVTSLFPDVRPVDIHDRNVLYSFQTDGEHQMFLILKILLPNKLKIKQFVKAISWPKIKNESMVTRSGRRVEWFILLSHENYIEVSEDFVDKCMRFAEKCISNRVPKAIISGTVTQPIAQYFRMKEANPHYIETNSKLFLLNIERNVLVYTSVDTTEIRISCENKKPQVSSLSGRGVLEITKGCEVSSQFFTLNFPQQLGTLNYQNLLKIDESFYTNIHIWNTSALNMRVTLKPIPNLDANSIVKPMSVHDLPFKYIAVFAIMISSFCFSSCCCLLMVSFCRYPINNTLETHV